MAFRIWVDSMMKKRVLLFGIALIAALAVISVVRAAEQSVCCETTADGFYCQNTVASNCAAGVTPVPTSCDSTSFCKGGYCFDSTEGTCISNTPQNVCNLKNGTWSVTFPPQCDLGCCQLGDQASFVSLTRCKKLSSFLGLQTNFNKQITDEIQCILTSRANVKGACVFETENERTCKMTTQADCATNIKGEFYEGKLCSAENLSTNCGPTTQTTCLPGKDGVYFLDSCGNVANIYDSSKINNKEYWNNIKQPSESCSPNDNNAGSGSCGNCDYLLGSTCRDVNGNDRCVDLSCVDETGKARIHGESWCVYTDKGGKDNSNNAVGSRYYREICMNGQVVSEACDDFRQQVCLESETVLSNGKTFSQAACRVNRWRDCVAQTTPEDCGNTDQRDCRWVPGVPLYNSTQGACLPLNTPGLKFWNNGTDSSTVCSAGSVTCAVKWEKGLFSSYEPSENANCLTAEWASQREQICQSLGDCGVKINWFGSNGYKTSYTITKSPDSI